MARNRKRTKDRRTRRTAPDPVAGRGVATARGARGPGPGPGLEPVVPARDLESEPAVSEHDLEPEAIDHGLEPGLPGAIEHATPDVELAEAQLAVGRSEPASDDGAELGEGFDGDEDLDGEGERARTGALVAAPRALPGGRLVNFLQGSWNELQRVQWPDRRQVMQATGVVIGFVIVAGLFLGVADLIATKVVNLILK